MTTPIHGANNAAQQFTRWIPTFDRNKHGVELIGPAVSAAAIGQRISALDQSALLDASFVIIPLAATSGVDISAALAASAAACIKPRICLLVRPQLLTLMRPSATTPEGVGLMLNIEDGSAPFSVLIHDRLEAIRLDPDYAKSLSQDIRGSLLLETLTRFAQNAGLAILGPSFQDSENGFGLPIRFDYVAENTIVDVLARHRLDRARR